MTVTLCVFLPGPSGCSTHPSVVREVSQAAENWDRPRIRLSTRGVSEHGTVPGDGRAVGENALDEANWHEQQSTVPSPLRGYILEALERNPSVKAAVADARARLERIAQVTSLPDPFLRAVVRPEPIRTAAGDMCFTLSVGQKIPLPAKLDRAGRIAAAEVRMAIERLNAARLRVIADVEQAYFHLYLTDRSIELTEAHRQSLEDLEQVLTTQYRVGKVEQQDLLRIQTEIAKLRDEESRLGRRRVSAAAAINQLLDRPPTHELPVTKQIVPQESDADVDQLIALAAEHNPELAVLTRQAERDREEVELVELGYWPDPTIGFEWAYLKPRDAFEPPNAEPRAINRMSETGTDSWALMLQFNVPLWFDRIEAVKREARLKLQRTQHEKHAALNRITFRIFDAWTRVETQQDTIRLLESTLIPQTRQTYEVSLTAYQAGRSDFLTVIDNWRRLLGFELMLHRETADLETAFSQLQHEVGLQLIRGEIASGTGSQGEQP